MMENEILTEKVIPALPHLMGSGKSFKPVIQSLMGKTTISTTGNIYIYTMYDIYTKKVF